MPESLLTEELIRWEAVMLFVGKRGTSVSSEDAATKAILAPSDVEGQLDLKIAHGNWVVEEQVPPKDLEMTLDGFSERYIKPIVFNILSKGPN